MGRPLFGDRCRRRHSENAANLGLFSKGWDIRGVFLGRVGALNPQSQRRPDANLEKLVKWTAEGKISSHVERAPSRWRKPPTP